MRQLQRLYRSGVTAYFARCYSAQSTAAGPSLLVPHPLQPGHRLRCLHQTNQLQKKGRWTKIAEGRGERIVIQEEEEEEEADEEQNLSGERVLNITAFNRRVDTLARLAFKLSINGTDEAIHSGKIRINTKLPSKRSVEVLQGDVVDFLKGPNPENAKLTDVMRFEMLGMEGETTGKGKLKFKLRKYDSLSVPDYY